MSTAAVWTPTKEASLVDFLVNNKAAAGDGGNFRRPTFEKAAAHLAPLHQRGGSKTYKMCQNKFTAFRAVYKTIQEIKLVSGWTWNDNTGASINTHSASSWNDYVAKHPNAKPFRNKGWSYYAKMDLLMPRTIAGANMVYHPTPAAAPQAADLPEVEDGKGSPPTPGPADASDEEFEADAEEIPQSSASGSKRRREAATPTKPAAKRPRASHGANALMTMSESLNSFSTAVSTALAPPATGVPPTPTRRTKAIKAVAEHEKAWLSVEERVRFIDFLSGNKTEADVYIDLVDGEAAVRMEWVRMKLERLGITVYIL